MQVKLAFSLQLIRVLWTAGWVALYHGYVQTHAVVTEISCMVATSASAAVAASLLPLVRFKYTLKLVTTDLHPLW